MITIDDNPSLHLQLQQLSSGHISIEAAAAANQEEEEEEKIVKEEEKT